MAALKAAGTKPRGLDTDGTAQALMFLEGSGPLQFAYLPPCQPRASAPRWPPPCPRHRRGTNPPSLAPMQPSLPAPARSCCAACGKGGESGDPQPPSLGAAHRPSHGSFGCSHLLLSSKVTWVSPPAFAESSVASQQQNPKHFPARCTAHHCHFPRETEGKGTGLQSTAQRRASHEHETLTGVNMAVAPPRGFASKHGSVRYRRWSPRASPAPHGEPGTAARDTKGHVGENRGRLSQ